jgi:hypothetical protein
VQSDTETGVSFKSKGCINRCCHTHRLGGSSMEEVCSCFNRRSMM